MYDHLMYNIKKMKKNITSEHVTIVRTSVIEPTNEMIGDTFVRVEERKSVRHENEFKELLETIFWFTSRNGKRTPIHNLIMQEDLEKFYQDNYAEFTTNSNSS